MSSLHHHFLPEHVMSKWAKFIHKHSIDFYFLVCLLTDQLPNSTFILAAAVFSLFKVEIEFLLWPEDLQMKKFKLNCKKVLLVNRTKFVFHSNPWATSNSDSLQIKFYSVWILMNFVRNMEKIQMFDDTKTLKYTQNMMTFQNLK